MADIEFKPPGPGVWELEQTHFSRPATRYGSSIFPRAISKGFSEGTRRYGLLLETLDLRVVNDFVYGKFSPVGAADSTSSGICGRQTVPAAVSLHDPQSHAGVRMPYCSGGPRSCEQIGIRR
jgi:hypothetical protein